MATSRHAAAQPRTGSDQDDAAWGDEREIAVWGQVSARTLHLVILLNLVAGLAFVGIDADRYWPSAVVFVVIALGFTAYSGWAARRSGVDLRSARTPFRTKGLLEGVAVGAVCYLLGRFVFRWPPDDGWTGAAGVVIGSLIAQYFFPAWKRRRTLRSQQRGGLPGADDPD